VGEVARIGMLQRKGDGYGCPGLSMLVQHSALAATVRGMNALTLCGAVVTRQIIKMGEFLSLPVWILPGPQRPFSLGMELVSLYGQALDRTYREMQRRKKWGVRDGCDLVKENTGTATAAFPYQDIERQTAAGWKPSGSDCASGLDQDNLLIVTKRCLGRVTRRVRLEQAGTWLECDWVCVTFGTDGVRE
jgi:hypothetical protein